MRNDSFDREGSIKPDATVATPAADQGASVGLGVDLNGTGGLGLKRLGLLLYGNAPAAIHERIVSNSAVLKLSSGPISNGRGMC